ncbi:MAG: 50S ribosomal protein L30 [Candidatus Cloacimonetes bacterium HGW-Cloacimonetes-2]|jgi:large subunit ribosomal protein L30|nr:MAG: 50S ribosomal protein L30 [Candidatus Cloacimonetes bacterium HGW-Cloacimonetes-2]
MKIKVTQIRSTINRKEDHKRVIEALGLGKIGKSRIHDDSPSIMGMIKKVSYLLKVENVQGE